MQKSREELTPDLSQWYSVRHAAELLGISQVYVYQLLSHGQLEAVTTELGKLVNPASVAAFAAQRHARLARRAQAAGLAVNVLKQRTA